MPTFLRASTLHTVRAVTLFFVASRLIACAAGRDASTTIGEPRPPVIPTAPPTASSPAPGRGVPPAASADGTPWLSFYGASAELGDIGQAARTFRVVNLEADPDQQTFTATQIATLKAGGVNRVISYFNVGACERSRRYWSSVPDGFVSCAANSAAQLGPYAGYPDETWMNLGNADYQRLLLDYVAPRLVAQGIDGFFFDNLEIVEHAPGSGSQPVCDVMCAQGGLDLVRRLRERYPTLLFIMQNATGTVTRLGTTGGVAFPTLLDGISHEEVYTPYDVRAEQELLAWQQLGLTPGGRPFWIATEDYVGSCTNTSPARANYAQSRARRFSPYVTDASAGQRVVCYWSF